MFKITSIILLSCVLGLFSISPALATDDFRFTISTLSEFEANQLPFVNGKAVTLDKNPVSDVQIQVNFPSGIIKTSTNSTGQFSVASPVSGDIGEHTITVYANKDNKFVHTQITYQVIAPLPPTISLKVTEPIEEKPKVNDGIVELDPFSKMILQQIEEQKTKEIKQKNLSEEQQAINAQRLEAQASLQNDLKSSEKGHEYNSPRNAFLRFLADVDSSAKNIFWQQFLFTENIVNQALEAKEDALEEGKSSLEATNIFQQKAAITHNELVEFNKKFNSKHGNIKSDIQDQFDENGKLPRVD